MNDAQTQAPVRSGTAARAVLPNEDSGSLIEVATGRCWHVVIDGPADGLPLVLLPALGTDVNLWGPQLALARQGYRLIRIDLPGHGA